MTIDEAIQHAEEVVQSKECEECRLNHAQLATWLKELKQVKAESAIYKALLNDIYPTLAGRVIQLQDAGEVQVATMWDGLCRKVLEVVEK